MQKENYQLDIFGKWQKCSFIVDRIKKDKKFYSKKQNYNVVKTKYKTN